MGRYQVQERFADWGEEGQRRLSEATAVVVGVGALGGTAAGLLARAGVGRLRLIDPDRPSLENLHRQLLYTEDDVARGSSKVEAARSFLLRANSSVAIEIENTALNRANAARLLEGARVVLDGLDNRQDRLTLNRVCLALGIPWVHAGVVATKGQLMVVRSGGAPCLECVFPNELERPEKICVATHGVIGPLPSCMASLQANEAIKILLGKDNAVLNGLLLVDLWLNRFSLTRLPGSLNGKCPACGNMHTIADYSKK